MSLNLLVFLCLINFVTFMLYGVDKYKAIKKQQRISEASLLMATMFMGSVGAIVGMLYFKHKTRKWKFRIICTCSLVVHLILIYYMYLS